jgi:hypothetical protein
MLASNADLPWDIGGLEIADDERQALLSHDALTGRGKQDVGSVSRFIAEGIFLTMSQR